MPVTINLEDSVLDRLALNPAVVAAIPAMYKLGIAVRGGAGPGCGRCGRATNNTPLIRNAVKAQIATTPAFAASIKQALGADHVRVFYSDGSGVQEALI